MAGSRAFVPWGEAIAAGDAAAWADKARGVLADIAEAMIKGAACLETRKAVRP